MRTGAFEGEDVYLLGEVDGLAVVPEGFIYVYDRQVPALRKYAPDGTFVATFGRHGEGPGEYKNSDGGLAVLSDDRVLLRDPGNGRINVYSADGQPLDRWPVRGGYIRRPRLYTNTKPPFRDVLVDRDGRIWVLVSQPGRESSAEEGIGGDAAGPPGGATRPPAWEEPIVFDVFEPNGRYLGQVHTPDGFSTSPEPVIRGERVWAVVRDALGVQSVVRFRIAREPASLLRERDESAG